MDIARDSSGTSGANDLDHQITMNESHLRALLRSFIHYYNTQRTHLEIRQDSPKPREVQTRAKIDKVAVVNGLHSSLTQNSPPLTS
jgi:hypothetical protein